MENADLSPVSPCPGQLPLFPGKEPSAGASSDRPDGRPHDGSGRLHEEAGPEAAVQPYLT